jgi:hypothetical protein
LQLISGGNGYLSAPAVSCGGAGFAGGVQPQIICLLASGIPTAINQEIYPFSGVSFANQPGIAGIIGVRGVSILWNTYRFTTARYSFSKYQARVRVYNNTFTDVPRVSAQFGQGESGSIYLYPVPNAVYIMEWDCICDVTPLIDDTTVELIPAPWNTCVQYYAAYKAQEIAQNFDIADRMYKAYERFMKLARTQSQPGAVANWYGRA